MLYPFTFPGTIVLRAESVELPYSLSSYSLNPVGGAPPSIDPASEKPVIPPVTPGPESATPWMLSVLAVLGSTYCGYRLLLIK